MGRPSKYTPEIVELILHRIETSKVGLRKLCDMHADMPNVDTIYEWRARYDDFSERYLNSRRKQAHILAENVLDIADETRDMVYEDPKTGAICIDAGIVAMQKMRISSNTWLASRIDPKNYASQKQVEEVQQQHEDIKRELEELRAKLAKQNEREY